MALTIASASVYSIAAEGLGVQRLLAAINIQLQTTASSQH